MKNHRTTQMPLPQRVDTALSLLLALVFVCLVAWHSPFLKLDAGMFLVGIALAYLVFWGDSWSPAFLTRAIMMAYFFRCVVLYPTGNEAVKFLAVQDIGLGLIAVLGAQAVRQVVCNYAGRRSRTGLQQVVGDEVMAGASSVAGERVEGQIDGIAGMQSRENAVWSPPQFTLGVLFVLTLAWSGLLAVAVTGGLRAVLAVLLVGLLWFLVVGCARLVSLGDRGGQ